MILLPMLGFGQSKEFIYIGGRAIAVDTAPPVSGNPGCPPNCGTVLPTPTMSGGAYAAAGMVTNYTVSGSEVAGGPGIQYRVKYINTAGILGYSAWVTGALPSTVSTTVPVTYLVAGTYNVTAQARLVDDTGVVSPISTVLTVNVIQAPLVSGPTSTFAGAQNTYTFTGVTSNMSIPIQIIPNWGDGSSNGSAPTGYTSLTHAFIAAGNLNVTGEAWVAGSSPAVVTPNSAPLAVSVGDNVPFDGSVGPSGSGTGTTFSTTFLDYGGTSAIYWMEIEFAGSNTANCDVLYLAATNTVFLSMSTGNGWAGSGTPGSSGTLSNGVCSVSLAATGVLPVSATGTSPGGLYFYSGISFLQTGVTWSEIGAAVNGVGTATVGGGNWIVPSPETVTAPNTPSGPQSGTANVVYTYSTGGSTSSYGNPVQYMVDWGDLSNSGWLPVGTTSASHSWGSSGVYQITAVAMSSTGVMSGNSQVAFMNIPTAEHETFSGLSGTVSYTSSYTISLGGNDVSTGFEFCGQWLQQPSGVWWSGCTNNYGATDANGNWSQSGTFSYSVIGDWWEFVFMNDGYVPNYISFTVQ